MRSGVEADGERLAPGRRAGADREQAGAREDRAAGGREHEGERRRARGQREDEVAVARRVRARAPAGATANSACDEAQRQGGEPEDADPRRGDEGREVARVVEDVARPTSRVRLTSRPASEDAGPDHQAGGERTASPRRDRTSTTSPGQRAPGRRPRAARRARQGAQ